MDAALPFLGFDLSTPATLVVLVTSPEQVSHCLHPGDNRTEHLFPSIRDILAEAGLSMRDIRSLGVGRGPGAFTGVRNAVMAAKTLAWALDVPLYSPTTLEVLARGVEGGDVIVPLIDARRREVYCAVYVRRGVELVPSGVPQAMPPGEVAGLIDHARNGRGAEVVLVGTGAEAYRELLSPLGRIILDPYPRPRALWEACRHAMLENEAERPLDLLPMYVRTPDAKERASADAPVTDGR